MNLPGLDSPGIEMNIGYLRQRPGNSKRNVVIQTQSGDLILFKGIMLDGKLKEKIDPKLAKHPAWRSRLVICMTDSKVTHKYDIEFMFGKYPLFMRGSFKNGKLHGIVQIFGRMTVDPKGHCSNIILGGLSFFGWFENGKPTGPCWRRLIGRAFVSMSALRLFCKIMNEYG